jgi:Mlc titration factor MtfA (ptsG expression regulator)
MSLRTWTAAFEPAFRDLARQAEAVDNIEDLAIDPYATESPAEFFAVMSEYFFEWPDLVWETYPAVYDQMRRFYRQDPLLRFHPHHGAAS